jgi:plasmid maintenance system antidote protein VapI
VPLGLSPGVLAEAMGMPCTRVERIVAETSGVTAGTPEKILSYHFT